MEPPKDNQMPAEINSSLLLKSINYHGQELLRALQVEHGEEMVKHVDTRCLDYVEYHKRAPQAEFHLRSKRQRLLQFIAKKASPLFRCVPPRTEKAENEEIYAVLPPIEKYMGVPQAERRNRFFEDVQRGDLVIGLVVSKNHPAMGSTSRGNYNLNLLCFDGGKNRYIKDLAIKAEIQHGDYNYGEYVRGYICTHSVQTGKVVVATHYSPDMPAHIKGVVLGRISQSDLPKSFLLSLNKDLNYATALETIPSFNNPSAIENLCRSFGLPLVGCASFMKKFVNANFPKNEFAIELRKKQMSHWAMHSLREGAKFSKEDKITDAFQCLNNALVIDPENADAYVQRGALYISKDNFEQGITDFKSALSYDPEHRGAKKFLSDVHMMLGQKFAGICDVERSYENFKRAVEYNPSNKDAVAYLTAIMSVRSLEEAEKAEESESNPDPMEITLGSPVVTSQEDTKLSTTSAITTIATTTAVVTTTAVITAAADTTTLTNSRTDAWSGPSAETWQSSVPSFAGPYPPSWSGSSSGYPGPGPSAPWQNTAPTWTAQSSAWYGASSAWSNMASSTWTPGAAYPPVVPPTAAVGIPQAAPSAVHNSQPVESQEAIKMPYDDQLAKLRNMIEEERDKKVLKRSHSRSSSQSSSSSSTSRKNKPNSRHRKKRCYRDKSSGDESSRSSISSAVDEHKLKCEEFLERNRRQMEKKQTHTRDTKGASKKDSKEDSLSKKDHHRKLDYVHKKDCLKKIRTSSKDRDKTIHKDSVCPKKDKKQESVNGKKELKVVDNSSGSTKKEKKTEEKSRVELSHVNEIDSDVEEIEVQTYEDRGSNAKVASDSKESGGTVTVKTIQKPKVVTLNQLEDEKVPADNSKLGSITLNSSSNLIVYLKCAIQQGGDSSKIVACEEVSPADAADLRVINLLEKAKSTVEVPIPSTSKAEDKSVENVPKLLFQEKVQMNDVVATSKKSVESLKASSSKELPRRKVSDGSIAVATKHLRFEAVEKIEHERKKRAEREKRAHYRRHRSSIDDFRSEHELDNYGSRGSLSPGRRRSSSVTTFDRRIRKVFYRRHRKHISRQEAQDLYLKGLHSITKKYYNAILQESLRRIEQLV